MPVDQASLPEGSGTWLCSRDGGTPHDKCFPAGMWQKETLPGRGLCPSLPAANVSATYSWNYFLVNDDVI